jgi:replicative DNA helicase
MVVCRSPLRARRSWVPRMRDTVNDITAKAREAVKAHKRPDAMPTVHTLADIQLAAVEKACKPRDTRKTVMTGNYRIDDITGGVRGCWVVGGDTNIGKSTFAVAVAHNNFERGLGSLIVSAEDPPELYGARFLQCALRLDAKRIRDSRLTEAEKLQARDYANRSVPWPCYLSADGVPIETVIDWVTWAVEEYSLALVIWDYLGEFTSKYRAEDERLTVKFRAKAMRTCTRSLGVAGMQLSQLTVNEKTGIPTRANIRDCRDVASGSDVIALLYMDGDERLAYLDKVKDGPAHLSVPLSWDSDAACFCRTFGECDDEPTERVTNELTSDFDDGRGGY